MPLFDQKTFVFWVLLAMVFFSAVVWIIMTNNSFSDDYRRYFSNRVELRVPKTDDETVRLQLEFGNGRKRAFRGWNAEGLTVLAALRLAGQAGGFNIETDEKGNLVKIADVSAVDGREWKVFLNGASVPDLPGHLELAGGEQVVFKYE